MSRASHTVRAVAALLLAAALLASAPPARAGSAATPGTRLRLATTTSTENSGLLAAILPPFEARTGVRVDVIAVGTGRALALGAAGDVDALLVHDREREERFVAEGHGRERRDLMYNEFVILGPREDPAGVSGAPDVAEAMRRIAGRRAAFVSRGDGSGTHDREKALWRAAGIAPEGSWYVEAGLGMGGAIRMAAEKRGYTLSDRGTAVAYRAKADLAVLFRGGPALRNPYGVIAVDPARHPGVRHDLALRLIDYLTGPEGQARIAGFRAGDEPLFRTYGSGSR